MMGSLMSNADTGERVPFSYGHFFYVEETVATL